MIVANAQGAFRVSGPSLPPEKDFIDGDGLKRVTNLTHPQSFPLVGDKSLEPYLMPQPEARQTLAESHKL